MKPIWPILSLLLGCTEFDESVDSAEEELTERMRMGRIEGVVRRSAALQGDGLGNLIVLAFFAQTPNRSALKTMALKSKTAFYSTLPRRSVTEFGRISTVRSPSVMANSSNGSVM